MNIKSLTPTALFMLALLTFCTPAQTSTQLSSYQTQLGIANTQLEHNDSVSIFWKGYWYAYYEKALQLDTVYTYLTDTTYTYLTDTVYVRLIDTVYVYQHDVYSISEYYEKYKEYPRYSNTARVYKLDYSNQGFELIDLFLLNDSEDKLYQIGDLKSYASKIYPKSTTTSYPNWVEYIFDNTYNFKRIDIKLPSYISSKERIRIFADGKYVQTVEVLPLKTNYNQISVDINASFIRVEFISGIKESIDAKFYGVFNPSSLISSDIISPYNKLQIIRASSPDNKYSLPHLWDGMYLSTIPTSDDITTYGNYYWSEQGLPRPLTLYLQSPAYIGAINISFFNWNRGRVYTFDVEAKLPFADTFITLKENLSSSNSEWTTVFLDEPFYTDQIRIVIKDQNQNNWANIWEIVIYDYRN